jgi:YHS domain-containing protein
MWKSWRAALCGLFFVAGACAPVMAKEAPVYTPTFSNTAVSGYDPVAYFSEQKPVKGNSKISADYNGAKWFFSSIENRDKFVAAPEQYAPQYGGYCAWAVSQGYTASADPLAWRIVNNRLYLNYNAEIQKKWEMSIPELVKKADTNWPKVIQ